MPVQKKLSIRERAKRLDATLQRMRTRATETQRLDEIEAAIREAVLARTTDLTEAVNLAMAARAAIDSNT